MNQLEADFDRAMMNVYKMGNAKCNYKATLFLQMLHAHRGVETARRLLAGGDPQYGFRKLRACGCLHITVECLVLNERFSGLFDDQALETARQRLREYNFDPESCERATYLLEEI